MVHDSEYIVPLVGVAGYDALGYMVAESAGDVVGLQWHSQGSAQRVPSSEQLCPWSSLMNRLMRSANSSAALSDLAEATYEHAADNAAPEMHDHAMETESQREYTNS